MLSYHCPGDLLPMQPFVPIGLLCPKAVMHQVGLKADIRIMKTNGLVNKGLVLTLWQPQHISPKNSVSAINNGNNFYDHIVDAILEPDDALVGLMTDINSVHHTIILARCLRQRSSLILVCPGCPASSSISHLLEVFPFINLVVREKVGILFTELLQTLKGGRRPTGVLGVTWRYDDVIVNNADRRLIDNFDKLPIPAFAAYDMATGAPLYLDVERGCTFKYRFGATAPFWNHKYRLNSINRIIGEMILVYDQYGLYEVSFSHDIFTCDWEWTCHFCDRLIKNHLGMTWVSSTRTDLSDPELLTKMAAAGGTDIYYDTESGSDLIQKQLQKYLDLCWSRQIVQTTAVVGICPVIRFIVGYPMETWATRQDTLLKFFDFPQVGVH
ncbi:MAG TPA: hypothetical protein VGE97_00725, partial [Nitrososphaera sp.]